MYHLSATSFLILTYVVVTTTLNFFRPLGSPTRLTLTKATSNACGSSSPSYSTWVSKCTFDVVVVHFATSADISSTMILATFGARKTSFFFFVNERFAFNANSSMTSDDNSLSHASLFLPPALAESAIGLHCRFFKMQMR